MEVVIIWIGLCFVAGHRWRQRVLGNMILNAARK
jgi:hypothetical protein